MGGVGEIRASFRAKIDGAAAAGRPSVLWVLSTRGIGTV